VKCEDITDGVWEMFDGVEPITPVDLPDSVEQIAAGSDLADTVCQICSAGIKLQNWRMD
jgi:hypothetical protein